MKWAKMEAPTTVSRPHTTMDKLLIAPSICPISIALAVPTACELEPIAIPFAIDSSILNNLRTHSAITFPMTPVITITITASDT